VFVLLQQVSHGAIQFTAYEELRKVIVDLKSKGSKKDSESDDKLLVSLYNQCPLYIWVHRNCINAHILEVPIYTPALYSLTNGPLLAIQN
jgi:hypothetical protein